jgi:hypothetical protein
LAGVSIGRFKRPGSGWGWADIDPSDWGHARARSKMGAAGPQHDICVAMRGTLWARALAHQGRNALARNQKGIRLNDTSSITWSEADYLIWVATSDQGSGGSGATGVRAAFCWVVRQREGEVVAGNWNPGDAGLHVYHTEAILPAATAAFESVPEGRTVYVFSDVKFVTDILNADMSARMAAGYVRSDKKPLAYQEQWKTLDAAVARRTLRVGAGRPPVSAEPLSDGWRVAREFDWVKEAASRAARNIGFSFSDWDL